MLDADPPIDKTTPSIDDVKEVVAKAAGIYNFGAELLKAEDEAMTCGLHAVSTTVWHSGTISPDW